MRSMRRRRTALATVVLAVALAAPACSDGRDALTVYSGRSSELVGPLLERFAEERDIDIDVRYGETAQMAATILEEGDNSPADVFYAQDAGALGALAAEGAAIELPDEILSLVPEAFRSPAGRWVGTSGRARVLVYSPERVAEDELPNSVFDLTGPEWEGRVGWAPTNGSFQAFVTAMREIEGDARTREWLEAMQANGVEEYAANIPIVQAVDRGEIDVGLVNHYYAPKLRSEDPGLDARNHFMAGGDPGALINVAGAAVIEGSDKREEALEFVRFLLSEEAQEYFARDTFEYPLVDAVEPVDELPPLASVEHPEVDLSNLDDLRGTLDLLRDVGLL
ncbi:MAG TPA: iron ABC transporter substrate-binding protein [Acidimicrobiia bacterium]|nr:iron ABC transporter substrate-binding protein [Acidimicrobiia bacterium]